MLAARASEAGGRTTAKPPIAVIPRRREDIGMAVTLKPSAEQRDLLERLELPGHIAATLRSPSFVLGVEDARMVSDALGLEMARVDST